jgi:hypothetical protein
LASFTIAASATACSAAPEPPVSAGSAQELGGPDDSTVPNQATIGAGNAGVTCTDVIANACHNRGAAAPAGTPGPGAPDMTTTTPSTSPSPAASGSKVDCANDDVTRWVAASRRRP